MIKPTVGRIVWFTPSANESVVRNGSEPLAAIVTCVWSDTCVNLAVFDANGMGHSRTSVPLVQDDNPTPNGYYCAWMPYQKDQAAAKKVKAEGPEKTLHNSDVSGARLNVPDIKVVGNGDSFRLLCKASSEKEGWMKSSKALEIPGVGAIVQVTTQQRNIDLTYSIAEALTFVCGAKIEDDVNGGRKLVNAWPVPPAFDNKPTVDGYTDFRKKNVQPMRPYIPGEDLAGVSVSDGDTPEEGGMIAINPNNPADKWYVAKAFFAENYIPA